MNVFRSLFFVLTAISCADKTAVAGSYRSVHFVQPASSQRPWRNSVDSTSRNNPLGRMNDHFLSWDEAKSDHRTRAWRGESVARRRPGKSSWTTKLLFFNIAAYALQVFVPRFTAWGVKRSDLILQGRELYRLVSPVFLHGGPAHLAMNMYSLSNIGHDVERLFGPGRFLCTYILSGITGNVLSAFQSPNPALGASGAVFGILGAYTLFLGRHEWLYGRFGESVSSRLMQTAFLNIVLGFANPSIDNWGHIGGFLGGCAMAYYVGPRIYWTNRLDYENRMLVDRPIMRLPRPIERIPDNMSGFAGRIYKRLRMDRFLQGPATRPWQEEPRPINHLPTRSVKPQR